MNYYAFIKKWTYTILAVVIYTINVQIKAHTETGIIDPNYYFETGLILFLSYIISAGYFIPLITTNPSVYSLSWKNAFRNSFIENTITYLVVFSFLQLTNDTTVSRMVIGTSFISSFCFMILAHVIIPYLYHDISDQNVEDKRKNKKKTVTICGINYYPEPTGIGPQTTYLAETLVNHGYAVNVVTAFSYYPSWAKDQRDEGRIFRMDSIKGVTIRRCWLYVPKQPTFIKRVAQQVSFVVSSTLQLMFMDAPDFYIGVCPPFMVGPALRFLSKIKKAPYAIHIQDDEIGAAFETTSLPQNAYRGLRKVEKTGFKGAKVLSTISPKMKERLERQLKDTKINNNVIILSNKAHTKGSVKQSTTETFRQKFKTKRLLVYTGNLGDKQTLDDFIPAVASFDAKDLTLYICGEGAQKKRLKALVEEHNANNILFESLLSDDEHETLLAAADCCLLSEMTHKNKWLSPGICFASKMLSYMKHAKPILIYGNPESEISGIIRDHDSGFFLKKGQRIESLLQELVDCETLAVKGTNGHFFYETFLNKHTPMKWIKLMEHNISEKQKIEKKEKSLVGKTFNNLGEISLKIIAIPLAFITYSILAIPIKSGKMIKK